MADLDFGKIKLYVGNYDFWLESSQLAAKLQANANAKKKNKSKNSKNLLPALVRMHQNQNKQLHVKMLEKITLDDINLLLDVIHSLDSNLNVRLETTYCR